MLKAVFLSEKPNVNIQKELRVEFIKTEYMSFMNNLLVNLNGAFNKGEELAYTVFLVLNKVLLDNLYKHIVQNSKSTLIHQIHSNTFTKDLYINSFYLNQIFETAELFLEDRQEIENNINKIISRYLDYVYQNNSDNLNRALFGMFEYMNNHLEYLNVSYYKFELMDFRKPILLYTEREEHVFTYR